MTLFIIEERIGEVHDVLVAVNVGHGGKRLKKSDIERAEEKWLKKIVSTEDDGDNQGQTTRLYISKTGLQSSGLSPTDLTWTPICPSNPLP